MTLKEANDIDCWTARVDDTAKRTQVFDADSNAWAAKQTFDSREVYSGRKAPLNA